MVNAQISEVVVVSYRDKSTQSCLEVYSTWHGAAHRLDELGINLGKLDDWVVDRSVKDRVFATNASLEAELIVQVAKVQSGGV